MAEPGMYLYWSSRRVQTVAEDNGIALDGFRPWTLTPAIPFLQVQRSAWR